MNGIFLKKFLFLDRIFDVNVDVRYEMRGIIWARAVVTSHAIMKSKRLPAS